MDIREYVKSLFIISRFNDVKTALRIMKNNLKLLKEPSISGQTEK